MIKLFLAIGSKQVEEKIKNELSAFVEVVGITVSRDTVVKRVEALNPDVIILRETLQGNSNITDIIYELRTSFPKTRIIFIAGDRKPGDELLVTLVSYGIYDILVGKGFMFKDLLKLIKTPNNFSDISHLYPKVVVDEKNNRRIFESPSQVIEREVYIEVPSSTKAEPKTSEAQPVEAEKKQTDGKDSKISIPGFIRGGKKNTEKDAEKVTSLKQKIITFWGGKNGAGTTQIAYNTAVSLAKKNFKVIYIDLDTDSTTISYVMEIGSYDTGLDRALEAISKNDYVNVDSQITRYEDMVANIQKGSLMAKNYKKIPSSLDYMFFSHEFVIKKREEKEANYSALKDLCMYLTFQKDYDFIILDAKPDINNKLTETAFVYSNKIFNVVTQDITTIASSLDKMELLDASRIKFKEKLYHIVNKFDSAMLGLKDIEAWIGVTQPPVVIPDVHVELLDANYTGLPLLVSCPDKVLTDAFSKIEKIIFN